MFIAGSVWSRITADAKAATSACQAAVAYYTDHDNDILPLPRESILVVNATKLSVAAGATSPLALLTAMKSGISIFSHEQLHAKTYAFDQIAYVGSANVSKSSRDHLTEAVVRTSDPEMIHDVRKWIVELAASGQALTDHDMQELISYYQPPKKIKTYRPSKPFNLMVMEVTLEQGVYRNSQVQPPVPAWENFFGFRRQLLNASPRLNLTDEANGVQVTRPVVAHDHNYTIEIPGATVGDILRFKKHGARDYSYKLVKPTDREYPELEELLATRNNPFRRTGRLWVLI
ncbi:phospholipase D family protein [Salinarimonas sp. NSM]|uniref:phospholipase D family protein n=1 Tax=Salinarimonas sp. NSM TaxID=3458003 RepID=UPI0040359441